MPLLIDGVFNNYAVGVGCGCRNNSGLFLNETTRNPTDTEL